jgi:hypothetical protein
MTVVRFTPDICLLRWIAASTAQGRVGFKAPCAELLNTEVVYQALHERLALL